MKFAISVFSISVLLAVVVGCGRSSDEGQAAADSSSLIVMDEMPPMLDDVNDHPAQGPHGGDLVELGKEDFHAELVHGDEGILLYVLDSSATKGVAIPTDKLVISLKHDEQVKSFDLMADRNEGAAASQSSRFVSTDSQLDDWLDAGAEGAVVIEIEGKSYTGKIAHDHDGHK